MSVTSRTAGFEVDLIVSAVPIPVLIADYTPLVERFDGMGATEVRRLLDADPVLFGEVLRLPMPVAASPEWIRLYGTPGDIRPRDLGSRHFSREAYPKLYRTLLEQFSAPFSGTTSIVSEHTAPALFGDVMVRSHWRALEDRNGPMWDRIVIVDLDITDLRQAQRDLEGLLEAKDELVRLKDRLIATVAHEIRTPLSSIVGFAELLRETSSLGEAERQEMIELVAQESADLTNIVEDLVVAAKTDLGALEVANVAVDLKAQAAQAVETIDSARSPISRIPAESVRCIGDPARVRQVIRNLISNAVKYGGSEITIETSVMGSMGSLRVMDDGPGVREEMRERIFEAYNRGDLANDNGHSLGLGLHISRSLARHMGGDLTYRYDDGLSVFGLTLPLLDPAAN